MAKIDKAELKKQGDILKTVIAQARKKSLNFAVLQGKDTMVIETHLKKNPGMLRKQAKKNGGGPKGCMGVLHAEGKTLIFSVEDEPPGTFPKMLKKHFMQRGLPVKISFRLPGGGMLSDGDEGEASAATDDPSGAGNPLAAEWAEKQKTLEPVVVKYLSGDRPDSSRVRASWAAATENAGNGNFENALKITKNIEALIAAGGGASDPGEGVAPDQQGEARWLAAAAKMEPHVDEVLKAGKGDVGKVRAVWAFCRGKADSGDFAVALKSLGPLAKLIAVARAATETDAQAAAGKGDGVDANAEKLKAAWAKSIETMRPLIEKRLADKTGDVKTLKLSWNFALEKAENGDFATAMKALARIKPMLALDAVKAEGEADVSGDNEGPGNPKVEEAKAKLAAEKELKTVQEAEDEHGLVSVLAKGFGALAPDSWESELKRVKDMLLVKADALADEIADVVTSAKVALGLIKEKISFTIEERDKWLKEKSVFEIRFDIVERHPMHAEDPPVKGKITEIATKLAAAQALADEHKYADAIKALAPLRVLCDLAEKLGDALAHYNSVKADRKKLIDDIRPLVSTYAAVTTAKTDAIKLWDDAELRAGEEKFSEAVALLNKIPDAEKKVRFLIARQKDYVFLFGLFDTKLLILEGADAEVQKVLKEPTERLRKMRTDMDFATTNDFVKSCDTLRRHVGEIIALAGHNGSLGKVDHVKAYFVELAKFKVELEKFEKHDGRSGVEEFYLLMARDFASGKARGAEQKFGEATTLLKATQPQWVAMGKLADDCKAYLDKKKSVEALITTAKKSPNAEAAKTDFAQVDALMVTAASSATAKEFKRATGELAEVEGRLTVIKELLANAEALGKINDSDELDKVGSDFDAAFKVYSDMRGVIAGKDGGGHFNALILIADKEAKVATDASETEAPDAGVMRKALDTATALLENIGVKMARKVGYDAHLPKLETDLKATLTPLNVDDCIKTDIEAFDKLIADAKALATSKDLDFIGAEAKLAEASTLGKTAVLKGQLFQKVKDTRQPADDAVVFLKHPSRAPAVTDEIVRLEKLLADVTSKVAAGEMKTALAKATEAKSLIAPFKKVVTLYTAAVNTKQTDVTSQLPRIQGKPAVAPELLVVNKWVADMQTSFDNHAYEQARFQAAWIKILIDRAEPILFASNDYEIERKKAKLALDAVRAKVNKAIEAQFKAQEAVYKEAGGFATARNFRRAKIVVLPVADATNALLDVAQKYAAYDDARKKAEAKLLEAAKAENAELIRPLLVRIKGKYDNAVAFAAAGQVSDGKRLVEEVPKDCEDALAAAKTNAALDGVATKAGALEGDDSAGIKESIAEARVSFEEIRALPNSQFAHQQIIRIEQALAKAEADVETDPANAIKVLQAAIAACKQARLEIGHYEHLAKTGESSKKRVEALASTHPKKEYIKNDTDVLLVRIAEIVQTAMSSGDHKPGVQALEAVIDDMHAIRIIADAQKAYEEKRALVDPKLVELEKHDHRYAIKDEIDEVRGKLQAAAGKVAERKHTEAMALLEEADIGATDAMIEAKMHANEAPSKEEIQKILARPDGAKDLDEMIKGLDSSAKRKVLKVAFEARYDCELDIYATKDFTGAAGDMEAKGPNIARFYDMMTELPPKDTSENDSMLIFATSDTGGGSSFNSKDKKVVMREGKESLSSVYQFGVDYEVGDVDEDCKPKNQDSVDFFSWNTLHEVGHAVDDKHGFMKGKAGNEKFGGWTMYETNTAPVAKAIAKEFEYDETYVSSYMNYTAEPPIPELKAGVDPDEWERRRISVRSFVDDARNDRSPWKTASAAKRLTIGGTVYQESYKYRWSSYALSARSRGITGYQFRAPGEWFSELYAAYKSDKLKDNHPAVKAWLKDL